MNIFRRKKFEDDMDAELRFHMDAFTADLVRSGVAPEEAQRRARIEFGGLQATKDECRQASGFQMLDELRADLRLALRTFRQNRAFATVAIISIALAIGANTAIFGLVDAVMLRIFPVRDPGRLVFVENVGTRGGNGGPPYPCFELLRDKARSFEGMAAFSSSNMEAVIDRERELLSGVWVSGNFYELLGVRPYIGRGLSASDDRTPGKGGPDGPVAVLSYQFWQRRFGGDPAVIGRVIPVSGNTVKIVGVMPPEFMSLEPGHPVDVAVPMMLSDPVMLRERSSWWLDIVARLKPGVTSERARTEADALFQSYMADIPQSKEIRKMAFDHIELPPAAKGLDRLRRQFSKPLAALAVLVALVLLAACANVANLMLARASARRREFAIRLAIGSGRGRLVRQTLTEAMALVAAGAALGVILAQEGESALAGFFAEGANKIVFDLSLNGRVLLFTLIVSIVTALAFGLLPALRAARVDPVEGLQSGSRNIAGARPSLRLGRALVVVQVGTSMVLLGAAGLFIRTLQQLESVDLGFSREGILTMEVTPEEHLFGKPEWFAIQQEVGTRVRHLPGVRSAAWSTMTPLSGRDRGVLLNVPGFVPRSETDKQVRLISVSPDYFETFGESLRLGRRFTDRDDRDATKVAIINETAAKFYFGARNPVGTKVTFPRSMSRKGFVPGPSDPVYEIVGVVKDSKHESLREHPSRLVLLPIAQSFDRINRLALSVRCSGDPLAFAEPVRRELHSLRSTLLITNTSTIEKQVQLSLMKERLISTLSIAFGLVAVALACIGLYGIVAYAVTRRTNEIGIRIALGATGRIIMLSVLGEALMLAGAGLLVGIPAAFAVGRSVESLLYGVKPFDVTVVACAAAVLLALAAIAALGPATRARRMDPMSALRCE